MLHLFFAMQVGVYHQGTLVPGVALFLALIEDAICKHLIPALFDAPSDFVIDKLCIHFPHSVKQSGIELRNPVDGAPYNFDTSRAVYAPLANKIIDGGYLNTHHHLTVVSTAGAEHKATRLDQEREIVREFRAGKPALATQ